MSDEDIDEQYRRLSALDASRPSDAARRAILANARQIAAERRKPRRPHAPWHIAGFGALAAAVLAGIVMFPLLRPPVATRFETAAPSPPAPAQVPAAGAVPRYDEQRDQLSAKKTMPPPTASARSATPSESAALSESAASSESTAALQGGPARMAEAPAPATSSLITPRPSVQSFAAPGAARMSAPDPAAALRRAAAAGDIGALQSSLDRLQDVDARDESGRTALMLAAANGHLQAVRALLARGADPNAVDAAGATALQIAQAGGNEAIAKALLDAAARRSRGRATQ